MLAAWGSNHLEIDHLATFGTARSTSRDPEQPEKERQPAFDPFEHALRVALPSVPATHAHRKCLEHIVAKDADLGRQEARALVYQVERGSGVDRVVLQNG